MQGVLFALRTAKHKSTGVSPYEMMFARKPVLPIHFISSDDTSLMESVVSDESGEECLFDYSEIKKNLQMIKEVHNKVLQEASSSIKKAQEYQKRGYANRHTNGTIFSIGDQVLLHNKRRADRKGDKHHAPYLGPYKIVSIQEDKGTCFLSKNGEKLKTVHHLCNLKTFLDRNEALLPMKEAAAHKDPYSHSMLMPTPKIEQPPPELQPPITASYEKPRKFSPTNAQWCIAQSKQLAIEPANGPDAEEERGESILRKPKKIDPIKGDGNCLFRAISKEISLSEEHYSLVRDAAISTLKNPSYQKMFEDIIGKPVGKSDC